MISKAIICRTIMKRTNYYIGERVDYQHGADSFWDNPDIDVHFAAKYDVGYVRYKTIELLADEINRSEIKGAVAEVGVYKGQTSYALNWLFPQKKLYMFDTFEGFDEGQSSQDIAAGFSEKYIDFSDTSEEDVLKRMAHKDNCIVKKGFFPKTADGIKDMFCMVSIDVDLYQPIYDSLAFFMPKMNEGGYIIIHDYNNMGYKGVKQAVKDYEEKIGRLHKIPIPDVCGSLVISK